MEELFWLITVLFACLALAYKKVNLKTSTAILGVVLVTYNVFFDSFTLLSIILWPVFFALALLNVKSLRREHISTKILELFSSMLPVISKTERDALEAGNVWWEGELFSGFPNWEILNELPAAKLTDEEQAFLDGPTEELCSLLNEWEITHKLLDMPENVWAFIKKNGFFSMLIPKEYGGLEFSPVGISMVLTKIASRSATAASTIGVPNSLGPAELLLHYGTDKQKKYWLPKLARAEKFHALH